jgi:hypothetical protein
MSWTCPRCDKSFQKENQGHICAVVELDQLFQGKELHIRPLFEALIEKAAVLGEFRITTSPKSITLYSPADKAFWVLEPKKKLLDGFFLLDRTVNEFPIYRIAQPSRNRYAHFVRFTEAAELDRFVLGLLQEAYTLSQQRKG